MTTFAHVNLVARDWRALAAFYQDVFDCEPVQPEMELSGDWLAQAVGVPGARLQGMNLRLPGHGDNGPTMEIFQYEPLGQEPEVNSNTPCFAHICFAVDDVAAVSEAFLAKGGTPVGPLTAKTLEGAGTLTFQYLRDPEGNIVEILNWS